MRGAIAILNFPDTGFPDAGRSSELISKRHFHLPPDVDLAILSFFFHMAWEFLQARLFSSMDDDSHMAGIATCLQATLAMWPLRSWHFGVPLHSRSPEAVSSRHACKMSQRSSQSESASRSVWNISIPKSPAVGRTATRCQYCPFSALAFLRSCNGCSCRSCRYGT